MERVWWVTMIVYDGLLWYMGDTSGKSGCNGRPFFGGGRLLWKWWYLNRIYCHIHRCVWYMGNTSGKSGCNRWPLLAVEGFYRNDDVRTFVISGIVIFCMHGVVSYNIVSHCILLSNTVLHDIREVFKNPNHGFLPWWGGTPLPWFFFPLTFWPAACRDGGGVPPFAVIKKSVENWPKNSVF